MRVRVIGVGTRRGDDAAGLLAAERLAGSMLPRGVSVSLCERPGSDLVDALEGADAVVLVDATCSGRPPGTVRRLSADELAPDRGVSSHALGVAEALALAEALGRRPARVEVIGIEAGASRDGGPSPAVQGAVAEASTLAGELAGALSAGPAALRRPASPGPRW